MALFMATAAPSPLASSVEKTNGAKLSRLLIDGGTTVLRKIFDGHHPPANLAADLNANKSILSNLLKKKVLHKPQWDKLFLPGGVAPDSNTFDITLLFLLLTNICGLTPPPSGWHSKPPPSETSHEANIARVKFYRNVLYGHVKTTGVDTPTFSAVWTEISGVLVSLGLDQAEVDRLKAEKGGEQDYIDVLIEWADSEEDIKSQLKNIKQSQSKTHQAIEVVRQAQVKTQRTVDDVRHIQAQTQRTVEDIHETQASTQKTVEHMYKTQDMTQKAVEDVRQTQVKTQKSVEEVAAGLKEMRKKVDSLKDGRDVDTADEILRNLAKSEFRRDIEYYAERFQEGTREWIFDRVQNWLDDTSSQNRVMVISGNAGVGKSVIAAVICKRMQEAGRLSGSHFCQYNNVRYCKPQLMIQSLACHLSHYLPEYKRALVKKVSRNLGTDLNKMGVEELFALLFKEPLSDVGNSGKNLLMVIDGLDESEYQGRNELLDVIANQFCKLPLWIRFLVTTRPALNIAEKLRHLNPFQLKCDDEKNLEDVRVFFQRKLEHVVKLGNVGEFVERLVLKSEGLMLYAHFLILSVTENSSVFHEEDDHVRNLPLGISSVYHSYFRRLEREVVKELNITGEHFLNLLAAIAASGQPLPVDFVSKVLELSFNSKLAKRKVLKVLSSVSALLPICDGCLHVIHKSVKDWLTDVSCYGEHEFITDESEGHRILAALCTDELENLKRKGVHCVQFSVTERYALYHGVHHMLHEGVKREPHKLDELTKAYIIDLEIVYAKTCLNSTIAAEDLVWLKKQGFFTLLSKDNQNILDTLLFLLRKYLRRFMDTPRTFLQTILNQGGKVFTVEALNLLQNKYPEIPYMEVVHKETKRGGVVAQFKCSSVVLCLDVSPQLDYMVCECEDGMLQLWSLQTGKLMWTRPVAVEKSFKVSLSIGLARNSPSEDVSLFRSVVFHPTKECILPGIVSQAYTMEGDLKPLFPGSNCSFSVCSISGDKTKILTNCLKSSKCLVLWSLKNGSEVDRILANENILSFACSGDGRLLAISYCSGLISLVDVRCGFRQLAQAATPDVCGMVKFSPDHRFLFCCYVENVVSRLFCLSVVKDTHNTFSLKNSYDMSYVFEKFESFNDCGFSFGDVIGTHRFCNHLIYFLDEQRLLRWKLDEIEMMDIQDANKSGHDVTKTCGIALSLDGQTAYVASEASVTAWDIQSEKLKAEVNLRVTWHNPLCAVREGVLISTRADRGISITERSGTVEFWDEGLSECVKRWTNLPVVKEMIRISEHRVAVVGECVVKVLDTSRWQFVSTIPVLQGSIVKCNSKCQLLTVGERHMHDSLQLIDSSTVVWKKEIKVVRFGELVVFSPMEQFLVVGTTEGTLVLDAETGNTLRTLSPPFRHCKFISDEECVIFSDETPVKLFNVNSGQLLSAIVVENDVTCLAACPFNRLFAIGLENSSPNFMAVRVRLPRDVCSESEKR